MVITSITDGSGVDESFMTARAFACKDEKVQGEAFVIQNDAATKSFGRNARVWPEEQLIYGLLMLAGCLRA